MLSSPKDEKFYQSPFEGLWFYPHGWNTQYTRYLLLSESEKYGLRSSSVSFLPSFVSLSLKGVDRASACFVALYTRSQQERTVGAYYTLASTFSFLPRVRRTVQPKRFLGVRVTLARAPVRPKRIGDVLYCVLDGVRRCKRRAPPPPCSEKMLK